MYKRRKITQLTRRRNAPHIADTFTPTVTPHCDSHNHFTWHSCTDPNTDTMSRKLQHVKDCLVSDTKNMAQKQTHVPEITCMFKNHIEFYLRHKHSIGQLNYLPSLWSGCRPQRWTRGGSKEFFPPCTQVSVKFCPVRRIWTQTRPSSALTRSGLCKPSTVCIATTAVFSPTAWASQTVHGEPHGQSGLLEIQTRSDLPVSSNHLRKNFRKSEITR